MSEQIDSAVDLGLVPTSLPEVELLFEFVANVTEAAPLKIWFKIRGRASKIRPQCEKALFACDGRNRVRALGATQLCGRDAALFSERINVPSVISGIGRE